MNSPFFAGLRQWAFFPENVFLASDIRCSVRPNAGWKDSRAEGSPAHGKDVLVVPLRESIGNGTPRLSAAALSSPELSEPLYSAAAAKALIGFAGHLVPADPDQNRSN